MGVRGCLGCYSQVEEAGSKNDIEAEATVTGKLVTKLSGEKSGLGQEISIWVC